MPEIKHQFTGGKMNKDLDERIVPNGQYEDAMNIQVSTSEDSEVGTVQNILGNKYIPRLENFLMPVGAKTIASIADEKNDTLYYLVWADDISYIISYTRNDTQAIPVFVDKNNVLGFQLDTEITGINIIDDMLFWTDNKTEPKKINITRCKLGTDDFNNHTTLINESQGFSDPSLSDDIETKHITVIRKGPDTSLRMRLETSRDPNKIYTGVITITKAPEPGDSNASSFRGNINPSTGGTFPNNRYDFGGITIEEGSNTFNINIEFALNAAGILLDSNAVLGDPDYGFHDNINYGQGSNRQGLTGWQIDPTLTGGGYTNNTNIPLGTKVVLKPYDDDGTPPGLPLTDYVIKGEVADYYPSDSVLFPDANTGNATIKIKVLSIDGFPPAVDDDQEELKWVIDLFDDTEKLFEFKFPRFSYRYKYEDGEYSTFAPWTQVAFQPGAFDYHPRKGYNLGMTNRVTKVHLHDIVLDKKTPQDIVSIDILFKDEPSPSIYVVDTIRPDDQDPGTGNKWDSILNTNAAFIIEKETINSVVPSNQLLRPWDNVPRKALAQDVTGNRIVYGNYIQNYDVTVSDKKFVPQFTTNISAFPELFYDISLDSNVSTRLSESGKSIKSLREYQLGVVFTDKYGRETPVISNESGTIRVEKDHADKYNRITAQASGSDSPDQSDLKYYKFYIKETSGEYYNMAMDRWYHAEDGNIWVAFPSSDRNKIDIDTFLILKKGSDTDDLVVAKARYKVIAIENEAPDFIKTKKLLSTSIVHSTLRDVYGTVLGDGPVQGRNEFKLKYKAFFGTTGSHLDQYSGGQLYIEFENKTKKQLSDRYKIVSIEHDFDKKKDGTGITLGDSNYYIQIDRDLGADVNFITDDPTGLNPTKVEFGIITNIYKYEIENSPKFDGRFFVKLHLDEVFTTNIGKSFLDGLDYRIMNSKKIYYMKPNHREMHTSDLGHFLVNGGGNVTFLNATFDGNINNGPFHRYGYYAVPEFAAMALFFRRFKRVFEVEYNRPPTTSASGAPINWGPNPDTVPMLIHLKPGSGASAGHPAIAVGDGDSTYDADWEGRFNWTPATNWEKEFGYDNTYGYTHNPEIETGTLEDQSNVSNGTVADQSGNVFLQEEIYTGADNARDTEVWFVDGGPFAGSSWATQEDLNFNNCGRYENNRETWFAASGNNYADLGPASSRFAPDPTIFIPTTPANVQAEFGAKLGSGYSNNTLANTHKMELSFGGIKGAGYTPSVTPGFFNIAGWAQNTGGASNSTDYSNLAPFIGNLNTNEEFRWQEDPTGQIYVIGGNNTVKKVFRHSTYKSKYITALKYTIGGHDNYGILGSPGTSMAETLSFNFTKNWRLNDISPSYDGNWDPFTDGVIINGLEINIPTCSNTGGGGGNTATGNSIGSDLIVYVSTLVGLTTDNYGGENTLQVGMAFSDYTKQDGAAGTVTTLGTGGNNEFLVIRKIETLTNGATTFYGLWLGGYSKPLQTLKEHKLALVNIQPKNGENIKFVQVGMNGYSDNSEFNINTMAKSEGWGAITAVGHTLEFIEYIEPEEILSENPAIFETEPKEIKELDVYYEASSAIPIIFDKDNIHEAFPIGSTIKDTAGHISKVIDYDGLDIEVDTLADDGVSLVLVIGDYYIVRPDGLELNVTLDAIPESIFAGDGANKLTIDPFLWNGHHRLPWHNCYSFGNGVESNRIRDNFNLPFITNGVKVSTTLEHDYKEEHRKYGLIYSGIYNSVSGVNNLNQFIQAEKITKDINPIYGSIQKLHSRNTDLVALCEDKVLKILANKDAVFNADGNPNLTATSNVLGQTIPFSGEFGISTNPESFASENYRTYFADKVRGRVLRLSMDGLTPISDYGMKDWFKDNLKISNAIIGSYDDKKDEYNITLGNKPLPLPVSVRGSTKDAGGGPPYTAEATLITTESVANKLKTDDFIYGVGIPAGTKITSKTYQGGREWKIVLNNTPIQNLLGYYSGGTDFGTIFPFLPTTVYWNIDIFTSTKIVPTTTVSYKEDVKGWVSFKSFMPENAISMANDYYTFNAGNLWIHHAEDVNRNTFYNDFKESSVTVILNDDPGTIKAFNTLNYEGSQAKIEKFSVQTKNLLYQPQTDYNDQEIYNLYGKEGWYVDKIFTDKEEGSTPEFIEKEGKWFNNINRLINIKLTKADTADFTFQGIASVESVEDTNPPLVFGCTNPLASNYDPLATSDDGSCIIFGCTDPAATNHNPAANSDDGSCTYTIFGCTDPASIDYDPDATNDDGSCTYPAGRIIPEGIPVVGNEGIPVVDDQQVLSEEEIRSDEEITQITDEEAQRIEARRIIEEEEERQTYD